MSIVNWLLIHAGNAAAWLWGVMVGACAAAWHAVDSVLNPVLSPVLAAVNPICTTIGDGVYAALGLLPVWLGITVLSVVAGVGMLIVFHYTSRQEAIGRARDDITANLLALKLFKDDLGVAFRSQRRIFGALLRLQWHMLRPLLIMLFPMLLILAQMGTRYQWRPLQPGESTLLRVWLAPEHSADTRVMLESHPGLEVEVGAVPGRNELVWRVQATEPGRHQLRFKANELTLEKEFLVGQPFERVSAERPGRRWTSQVLNPVEAPLPADSPVTAIAIDYPGVDSYIYGAGWWLLYFFVVSMIVALVAARVFKTRF